MSTKTIVIVLQENSATLGEIRQLDHVQDAERLIESLLENGIKRQSIRVLAAQNLNLMITQKPVVSLLPADRVSPMDLPAAEENEETPAMSEDAPAPVEVATLEPRLENDLVSVGASPESEPYTRDGILFSSLFAKDR